MEKRGAHSDRNNVDRGFGDGDSGRSPEVAAQPNLGLCPDPGNRADSGRGRDSPGPRPDLEPGGTNVLRLGAQLSTSSQIGPQQPCREIDATSPRQ
jgi:hypothetical protein